VVNEAEAASLGSPEGLVSPLPATRVKAGAPRSAESPPVVAETTRFPKHASCNMAKWGDESPDNAAGRRLIHVSTKGTNGVLRT
jgi:hypothetical protein